MSENRRIDEQRIISVFSVLEWAACEPVEKCGEVVALGVRLDGKITLEIQMIN